MERRFSKFSGKTYSPELVDEKFRELMKSGLFTVLQIKPTPIGGNALRLDISAEEAKSKELGLALGYGSYTGAIVGVSYRDRDLFGYGRPLSTLAEWSERGYKAEILWEDPYFFDTDFGFKAKLAALTFDFDGGYSESSRRACGSISPERSPKNMRSAWFFPSVTSTSPAQTSGLCSLGIHLIWSARSG